VSTAIANVDNYLEVFTGFEKQSAGRELRWLRELREEAFARFCEMGFPTTRDEDWRFTNVSSIARTDFSLSRSAAHLSTADLEKWRVEGVAARLVFVNGYFSRELSSVGAFPKDVVVAAISDQLTSDPASLEAHLGRYLDTKRDAFCALNTAFVEDGAYVHVPRSVVLEAPVHLLFITDSGSTPTMSHPRNLFVVEDHAEATFIEEYVSIGNGSDLSNSATELVAGEGAIVSHYMLEREHREAYNISTLRIQQGRSANVASHSFLLGGGIVRNNVHPVLAGEGGECLINGLFIGGGRQHLDNYMHVEHASPHCSSRQFYNGILDGHAHGVFHGRIVVHKDAQKTDAKQTNRNLLLSDDAQIDTKPQLEIYADDVKCTHGATIGQIEENALFYLRSRGLDEAAARQLLLLAFADECLDRMKPGAARTHVENLIHSQSLAAGSHIAEHATATKPEGRNWEEVQ
jgi:Fe-S cluster assembly protein SufD